MLLLYIHKSLYLALVLNLLKFIILNKDWTELHLERKRISLPLCMCTSVMKYILKSQRHNVSLRTRAQRYGYSPSFYSHGVP